MKILDLEPLAQEYGLPLDLTTELVEVSIARTLSTVTKSPWAQVTFSEGDEPLCEIYEEDGGHFLFQPKKWRAPVLRLVEHNVIYALNKERISREYQTLKILRGKMVEGAVDRHWPNGDLRVRIELTKHFNTETVYARFPLIYQTTRKEELSAYSNGDGLYFYVVRLSVVEENSMPRVDIYVSRTSRKLPEMIMRQWLETENLPVEVECQKRVCGAFSILSVSNRVPIAARDSVSEELCGELVRLKVRKG